LSAWPKFSGLANAEADEEIGWLVRLVSEVRSVRSEMNVPGGAKIPLVLVGAGPAERARAQSHEETIERLARLDDISFAKAPPKGAAQIVLGAMTAALPLSDIIDMGAERARLMRETEKCKSEIAKIDAKLANASFVEKAPPEVVEENRERRADFEETAKKLQAALKRVDAAT
jgi:valyl-tRNA synthetase